MRRIKSCKNKDSVSTVLAAVALQDHLVKSLLSNEKQRPQQKLTHSVKPIHAPNKLNSDLSGGDKEYVLDKKPPPLTLAQRLGLMDAPKQLLTEEEWRKAKNKARDRKDFSQPCVICKEELGSLMHVLLSCTHVFHKSCLQAFERFTGRKSCPMCRKEEYQTRVVYDGRNFFHEKCATIIQSFWRGYVVRCWYKTIRQLIPPKNAALRKKFYEEKLHSITDRMVKSIDSDVNSFLREIDHSLEASRNIFKHFDDIVRPITETAWSEIEQKALDRCSIDCPICLARLYSQSNAEASQETDEPNFHTSSSEHRDTLDRKEKSITSINNQKRLTTSFKVSDRLSTSSTKDSKVQSKNYVGEPSRMVSTSQESKRTGRSTRNKLSSGCRPFTTPSSSTNRSQDIVLSHKISETNPADERNVRIETSAKKSLVLLSCSHIFHQTCLEALEEFAVGQTKFLCPVCRSCYQKKILP